MKWTPLSDPSQYNIEWDWELSSYGKNDSNDESILTIRVVKTSGGNIDPSQFVAEVMLVYDHPVFYLVPNEEQVEFFAWVMPQVESAMRTNNLRVDENDREAKEKAWVKEYQVAQIRKMDSIREAIYELASVINQRPVSQSSGDTAEEISTGMKSALKELAEEERP